MGAAVADGRAQVGFVFGRPGRAGLVALAALPLPSAAAAGMVSAALQAALPI